MVLSKSFALWLLILVLAVANGGLREGLLLRILPHSPAYILSGVILIACVLLVSIFSIPWLGKLTLIRYLFVGVFWLALTLAFEAGFGLLVRGQSVEVLLEAYRFKEGNIWPVVLLVVAMAPVVAAYARGLLPFQGVLPAV